MLYVDWSRYLLNLWDRIDFPFSMGWTVQFITNLVIPFTLFQLYHAYYGTGAFKKFKRRQEAG